MSFFSFGFPTSNKGFIIKDNFLNEINQVLKLSTEADELRSSGKLKLAGMGRGNEFWNDSKVLKIGFFFVMFLRFEGMKLCG